MSEPRLEDMGDYNSLQGEKRKIVLSVILTGIIIGIFYLVAYNVFDNGDDSLNITESVKIIPLK